MLFSGFFPSAIIWGYERKGERGWVQKERERERGESGRTEREREDEGQKKEGRKEERVK